MSTHRQMTEQEYRSLYAQAYHLPRQIEAARAKVRHLEAKARRFGMDELLEPGRQA